MVSVTPVEPPVWRELDRQLTLVRSLGEDVAFTGERLLDLLDATQHVIADLNLPVVLRRVVEVACTTVSPVWVRPPS